MKILPLHLLLLLSSLPFAKAANISEWAHRYLHFTTICNRPKIPLDFEIISLYAGLSSITSSPHLPLSLSPLFNSLLWIKYQQYMHRFLSLFKPISLSLLTYRRNSLIFSYLISKEEKGRGRFPFPGELLGLLSRVEKQQLVLRKKNPADIFISWSPERRIHMVTALSLFRKLQKCSILYSIYNNFSPFVPTNISTPAHNNTFIQIIQQRVELSVELLNNSLRLLVENPCDVFPLIYIGYVNLQYCKVALMVNQVHYEDDLFRSIEFHAMKYKTSFF